MGNHTGKHQELSGKHQELSIGRRRNEGKRLLLWFLWEETCEEEQTDLGWFGLNKLSRLCGAGAATLSIA